jgi:ABC-type sugar transport system ATPase subunit
MNAGIEAVSKGDIHISGANVTNVTPAKRHIAMVDQPLERGSGAPCC